MTLNRQKMSTNKLNKFVKDLQSTASNATLRSHQPGAIPSHKDVHSHAASTNSLGSRSSLLFESSHFPKIDIVAIKTDNMILERVVPMDHLIYSVKFDLQGDFVAVALQTGTVQVSFLYPFNN